MNKVKPEVKITLDKERTLKLDLNAMVAYEENTGKSLFSFQSGKMTAKDLRSLLWVCLIHEDKDLTVEQVGAFITLENMADVSEKVGQAFNLAVPESKGESDPLPQSPIG